MIEHSAEYDKAVVADSRRQYVRAVFDLVDPDMTIEGVGSNDESPYSLTSQIVERGTDETEQKIATLEPDRWALDGTWDIEPVDPADRLGQVGWEGGTLSGDDGAFSEPYPYAEQEISGVETLQAVSLQFSGYEWNGYPVDFTVDIYAGDQLVLSREVSGNTEANIVIEGFQVSFPTRMRLTVKRWSQAGRRVRVIRFLAGLYEEWNTRIIKGVDIYTESTFSGLAIPYSSCTLEVYNEGKRFDPYAPNSIFKSIEERQAIKTELGLRLEDGSTEWLPGGTYYQQSGGWALKDLTVQWKLVDMIGMLTKRRFVIPDTLPTTLGGWIRALVSSMGVNFSDRYIVDTDVENVALTAAREAVEGKFCGELLRFACMATNTWPRQDMATGNLRVGKLERLEGNGFTLDNMPEYATMEANDDIADITFALDNDADGNTQEVTFPGTNTDSDVSLSVSNPFVHTTEDARKAVVSCLFEYGGKYFSVRSRGNPSSETGDIMSVATQFGTEIAARLYKQQLKLDQGVMRNMPSYLVQSPNDSTYQNKVVLTGTGTWTGPDGVTQIKVTVIQGGTGGRGGGGGIMVYRGWSSPDDTVGGDPGAGGKALIVEIGINAGQEFSYSCGAAGVGGAGGGEGANGSYGAEGGETTFGQFTSANGKLYANGLMDIQTGAVYASPGNSTAAGYGCGGVGGKQGENGYMYDEMDGNIVVDTVVAKEPTPGTKGADGKPGCVIVEW